MLFRSNPRSIHIAANDRISFFFMANGSFYIYIYTYIYCIFFIHLSVDGHLGCLHVLGIVNSAAVNIVVHVSFQISVFIFSAHIPRNGIAGSNGS